MFMHHSEKRDDGWSIHLSEEMDDYMLDKNTLAFSTFHKGCIYKIELKVHLITCRYNVHTGILACKFKLFNHD